MQPTARAIVNATVVETVCARKCRISCCQRSRLYSPAISYRKEYILPQHQD